MKFVEGVLEDAHLPNVLGRVGLVQQKLASAQVRSLNSILHLLCWPLVIKDQCEKVGGFMQQSWFAPLVLDGVRCADSKTHPAPVSFLL